MKIPSITHLTVFPGTACNMGCSYCYLRDARHGGAAQADGAAILRGIAAFIRCARQQENDGIIPPGDAKITFLGGEPLLHGRNLKKWILAARRLVPQMPLRVFTNATLINAEWLSFFEYNGVSIALSLDGRKETNDRFRKFRSGGGKSAYDAVLSAVPAEARHGFAVCAAVVPDTAADLPENMAHIAALGFGAAGWAPDMSCHWPPEAIDRLSAAAAQFRREYIAAAKSGRLPFRISNMYETLAEISGGTAEHECTSITLAGDGRFYPCDKLLALPPEQIRQHSLDFGLDTQEWAEKREQFFNALAERGGTFHSNACLAGTLARIDGLSISAAEKTKIFISQQKLAALVRRELCLLAEEGLKIPLFREAHGISLESDMQMSN